ncbi:MAG: hypothetical protein C4K58_01985 [Flavobacteriaceae bacterium]|nr:MAG: hypothetical protein C4K58_01985 [Flavobacteriaceae bacterium]
MSILGDKWKKVEDFFSENFQVETPMDLDIVLFLIGVQELGFGAQEFKKDDKLNLMHIAVCRILSPFGYYAFVDKDNQGWPHYELIKPLPVLKPNEQTLLMKEAVIQYMEEEGYI